MKKIFNIIISTLLLSLLNFQTIQAATNENYGQAKVLKITMRKVELCTGFQGGDFDDVLTDAFCNDPVVVGSGDKVVDIASVEEGAAAAAYGQPTLLPLGETYTHLRVTIDKKFTMKGKTVVSTGSGSGDTNFCATKTTTDAMYGGGTGEAGKKYTHRVAVDPVANANVAQKEMDLYFVDGHKTGEVGNTFTHCYGDSCGQIDLKSSPSGWRWGYAPTASGLPNTYVAQNIPRASVVTDDMTFVYKLDKPYTVTTQPPSIDIAFSTKETLLVYEASKSQGSGTATLNDGKCAFTIGRVYTKISITNKRSRGSWR
tara:strand:- start:282 stop:1223 length:942 start_codon:yes stop_codon:yes gene_type:complete